MLKHKNQVSSNPPSLQGKEMKMSKYSFMDPLLPGNAASAAYLFLGRVINNPNVNVKERSTRKRLRGLMTKKTADVLYTGMR